MNGEIFGADIVCEAHFIFFIFREFVLPYSWNQSICLLNDFLTSDVIINDLIDILV